MINKQINLNFDITLTKNKQKIKFECYTNDDNTISVNTYIKSKDMYINSDDLIKEQLTEFGLSKEEIKKFTLLKNYKTTDIKHLNIELDKDTYDFAKARARQNAIDYLKNNTPMMYPEEVKFLLNRPLPETISFWLYTKLDNEIKSLYKVKQDKDNDKFTLIFILKLINKYQKYITKIKYISININNTSNTTVFINASQIKQTKTLRLNLNEIIPVIGDDVKKITAKTIPLHMLDIDNAGNKSIKFIKLFKDIKPNDYLSKQAPHDINYYRHKDDILILHYKHLMTDETEQNINHMLANAINEKSTAGKNPLSDEDMQYVSKDPCLITENKKEDGYISIFMGYSQNKAYNDELYYYDHITSNETIVKMLTAIIDIL